MTVVALHETIRPRWVCPSDVEWVASALPTARGSLADLKNMDEIGQEITTGLHAIETVGGRRFLVASDLYRIHAIELDPQSPLPTGSYRMTDGSWTRYAATIDTSQFGPYLARVDDEAPASLQLDTGMVEHIQHEHCDHPELVVVLERGRVRLFNNADDLRPVGTISRDPFSCHGASPHPLVAMQWPVMATAVESGMTRWTGAGQIGPFRSGVFNRLAVIIGIQITPPAAEEISA